MYSPTIAPGLPWRATTKVHPDARASPTYIAALASAMVSSGTKHPTKDVPHWN